MAPDGPKSPRRFFNLLRLGPGVLMAPLRDLDVRRTWQVLFHSILVGALAGGFACIFFYGLEWTSWLVLDQAANLALPRPGGELGITPPGRTGSGLGTVAPGPSFVLIPAVGGLLCGLLTHFLAPQAAGPGGGAYIGAFHTRRIPVTKRLPWVKGLASLVTIGTGGSAGREGPTLQSSAALGALLGHWLRLSERERRLLLVAGAAAGTGAMFRTPLGGALFAIEMLYRDDFETDAIVPAIVASVTGYSIVVLVFGPAHLLTTAPSYAFVPGALPFFALMALGLSVFGAVYAAMRRGADAAFGGLPLPPWSKPALGGLLLGAMALFVPEVLGTGYGYAQAAIDGGVLWGSGFVGFLVLLGLAFAKMVATSLTVGSGGSGGDMGPSLVIGGLVGGGFGLLFHHLVPGLVPDPGAFALVGMGAFLGGVAHVPVSSLVMVCELAGSYDLLAPLMLAEAVAFVALRRVSIYQNQVPGRVHSPAHRDEITVDILESILVEEVFHADMTMTRVPPSAPSADVRRALSESELPAVLVEDHDGEILGIVSVETLQSLLLADGVEGLAVAADMMSRADLIRPGDDLRVALHAFLESGASVLPVVRMDDGERPRMVGVITHGDVDRAYEEAMEARIRLVEAEAAN